MAETMSGDGKDYEAVLRDEILTDQMLAPMKQAGETLKGAYQAAMDSNMKILATLVAELRGKVDDSEASVRQLKDSVAVNKGLLDQISAIVTRIQQVEGEIGTIEKIVADLDAVSQAIYEKLVLRVQ